MTNALRRCLRSASEFFRLPRGAKGARRKDARGLPPNDVGADPALREAVGWLCRAQDQLASRDGGVARHYSLLKGWSTSYPETTGYIVPTMLACARALNQDDLRQRARRMLDWLVSIQFPEGGFQAGPIGAGPKVPTIFNTGQILMGLAAGVREFGEPRYREAMVRAADWLVNAQDPDGAWRRFPSPFTTAGDRTYDTHVAWGLLEAARIEPSESYADAALANVRWALRHQRENGWFDKCCLTDPSQPLPHTLGYALRGVVEAYRFFKDNSLLEGARRTADGLLGAIDREGFLPGRLDAGWQGTVSWSCLTGTVQTAICWLMLYEDTKEARYRDAAFAANQYVDGR